MLSHPVTISATALAALLRRERIGEPHITMSPTAMWYSPDERREAGAEINAVKNRLADAVAARNTHAAIYDALRLVKVL